jgi:hypothetical protein
MVWEMINIISLFTNACLVTYIIWHWISPYSMRRRAAADLTRAERNSAIWKMWQESTKLAHVKRLKLLQAIEEGE